MTEVKQNEQKNVDYLNIKVFDKWDIKGISVEDPGLKDYINLMPRLTPKTGAKYAGSQFSRSKVFIVERLINRVMVPGHKSKKHFKSSGHITGKAHNSYNIVKSAFEIIEKKLNKNPVEVLVKAVEYSAPREEVIAIEYGGARYPKAVDCAPQRRVDVVLRLMTEGAYQKSFNSKRAIEDTLATEIMNAYAKNNESLAYSKKVEVERQADSSR